MEFYIGGYAQGKLNYVLQMHSGEEIEVIDGNGDMETAENTEKRVVLNHLHCLVKNLLEKGENPEEQIEKWIKKHPDCVIISDEAGNGIVPMKREEREYRERLGRIQIMLAAKAERVERIICGIGQRLK